MGSLGWDGLLYGMLKIDGTKNVNGEKSVAAWNRCLGRGGQVEWNKKKMSGIRRTKTEDWRLKAEEIQGQGQMENTREDTKSYMDDLKIKMIMLIHIIRLQGDYDQFFVSPVKLLHLSSCHLIISLHPCLSRQPYAEMIRAGAINYTINNKQWFLRFI